MRKRCQLFQLSVLLSCLGYRVNVNNYEQLNLALVEQLPGDLVG